MSDTPIPALRPTTAGGLMRQARQAQGLHIAVLAMAIKVVPRKLELLEADQFDQLPDATFTRALAQTVCRSLKIDPAPILALLPPPNGHRLEQVAEGLNTPFRDRPGRLVPREWASAASPVLWIAVVIVLLTIAVYVLPARLLPFSRQAETRVKPAEQPGATTVVSSVPLELAASGAGGASSASPSSSLSPSSVASAPGELTATVPALAASEPVVELDAVTAAAASGMLQFRVSAQSWVEVTDARGQSLISRLLQPGESVGLDGVAPLKLKIGNAAATQMVFRGQPFDLAKYTRDNVARLEIK